MTSKKQIFRNKKNRSLLVLIILFLLITVGFALLSTTINISGSSTVINAIWDVHFDNIVEVPGSVEASEHAIIDSSGLNIDYTISLNQPGDYYEFTVDVVNDGNIDAKLSKLPDVIGVNEEQDVYVNHSIIHTDGTPIVVGEKIKAGESTNFKVRVEFDSNISKDSELPKNNQVMNLGITIDYEQD